MRVFEVGSRVFSSDPALGIGTVVNVISGDNSLPDSTLYDVNFVSGLQTLHGSELRPVLPGVSSCDEKERLWRVHQNALDLYLYGATSLANAVGMMAHTEFEFLYNKVRAARDLLVQAREQLNEHSVKHGC